MPWTVRRKGTRTNWNWRVRRVNVLTGKLMALPGDTYEQCVYAKRYLHGKEKPHYPVPVKLQTAWYSRLWQTKPNPFHSPRLYWDFIQGHFKLMGWL